MNSELTLKVDHDISSLWGLSILPSLCILFVMKHKYHIGGQLSFTTAQVSCILRYQRFVHDKNDLIEKNDFHFDVET
jgi:hypothetical protein